MISFETSILGMIFAFDELHWAGYGELYSTAHTASNKDSTVVGTRSSALESKPDTVSSRYLLFSLTV
jgi:hypothetical protein